MVLECTIEKYLNTQTELLGGFTVKLAPAGNKGIPDRLVILPDGVVLFVELKRPKGGVVAALQQWWQRRLRKVGHKAYYAKTQGDVDAILEPFLTAR